MLESTLNRRSVAPLRNLNSHAQPSNSSSTERHNAFLTASSFRSACIFTIELRAAWSLACFELRLKSSRGSLASALRSTEMGRLALRSTGLSGARLGRGGLGGAELGCKALNWKMLGSEALNKEALVMLSSGVLSCNTLGSGRGAGLGGTSLRGVGLGLAGLEDAGKRLWPDRRWARSEVLSSEVLK